MGKPAAFVVNFNGAKGRLNAKVVSPSGAEEEALIQEIEDGKYCKRVSKLEVLHSICGLSHQGLLDSKNFLYFKTYFFGFSQYKKGK